MLGKKSAEMPSTVQEAGGASNFTRKQRKEIFNKGFVTWILEALCAGIKGASNKWCERDADNESQP